MVHYTWHKEPRMECISEWVVVGILGVATAGRADTWVYDNDTGDDRYETLANWWPEDPNNPYEPDHNGSHPTSAPGTGDFIVIADARCEVHSNVTVDQLYMWEQIYSPSAVLLIYPGYQLEINGSGSGGDPNVNTLGGVIGIFGSDSGVGTLRVSGDDQRFVGDGIVVGILDPIDGTRTESNQGVLEIASTYVFINELAYVGGHLAIEGGGAFYNTTFVRAGSPEAFDIVTLGSGVFFYDDEDATWSVATCGTLIVEGNAQYLAGKVVASMSDNHSANFIFRSDMETTNVFVLFGACKLNIDIDGGSFTFDSCYETGSGCCPSSPVTSDIFNCITCTCGIEP